jgi:branched-subunit amino acid aminotransferase/4-amino-4-deoxychorismate lyase
VAVTALYCTDCARNPLHGLRVEERPLPMQLLLCRLAEGDLLEMFATGTAATVVPIGGLLYRCTSHCTALHCTALH